MTTEQEVIKTAYEQEGMSPLQIAECQGLDIVAVKGCLMQISGKYRKDCGLEDTNKDDLNFSDDDLRRVNDVILDIALTAEDPNLRFKAASYIRDDKKGRKEVVRNMGQNNFNVLMINEKLAQARSLASDVKNSVLGKVVNVN